MLTLTVEEEILVKVFRKMHVTDKAAIIQIVQDWGKLYPKGFKLNFK